MKYISLGELFNRGRRRSERAFRRQPNGSRPPRSTRRVPLSIELLEDRTVPSALPTPTVTGQTDIMDAGNKSLSTAFPKMNDFGATLNRSGPTVVADPLNPQKLVAVWVVSSVDLQNTPHEIKGPVVEGAFSNDAGKTWNMMPWRSTTADV